MSETVAPDIRCTCGHTYAQHKMAFWHGPDIWVLACDECDMGQCSAFEAADE